MSGINRSDIKTGIQVHIVLKKAIKSVGIYEVDCKLGHAIHGSLKIDVIGI